MRRSRAMHEAIAAFGLRAVSMAYAPCSGTHRVGQRRVHCDASGERATLCAPCLSRRVFETIDVTAFISATSAEKSF